MVKERIRHIASGLVNEIKFRASRSSGPGGQHANKTNTRVELFLDVGSSLVLNPDEKQRIMVKLANRINAKGELHLSCQVHRSQLENKLECIDKLMLLLEDALKVGKRRLKTAATLSSQLKRLEMKRQRSEKKRRRQQPGLL